VLIIAQTFRKLATFSLAIPTKISQPKMWWQFVLVQGHES
jgi:hypothetical protein